MPRQSIIIGAVLVVAALLWRFLMPANAGVGGSLKQLFTPLVALYLDTFNSPATAMVLCLAMIAIALLLLLYYRRKIGAARQALRQLATDLDRIDDASGSAAALERIDTLMERHPVLGKSWSIYRATLVKGVDGRIWAQFAPQQYLGTRALELSGLRLQLFYGLPNDFVGVGLVFTFLGLVAGLYFASQSMMSTDLGAARAALVLLLHAATFKFLTSITGIGLSLVLSWAQRSLVDRLYDALHYVQFELERLLPLNAAPLLLAAASLHERRSAAPVVLRTIP